MIKTFFIDGDSAMEVQIPNVFTPNNDGLNDCYKIEGLTKCDDIVFKVYNRWGQLQFETTNYQNCWNGRNMLNEEVTPGVYFYLLKIKKNLGNSIDQHGTITLIRE
jgi:gliding motility-associated-like protein